MLKSHDNNCYWCWTNLHANFEWKRDLRLGTLTLHIQSRSLAYSPPHTKLAVATLGPEQLYFTAPFRDILVFVCAKNL